MFVVDIDGHGVAGGRQLGDFHSISVGNMIDLTVLHHETVLFGMPDNQRGQGYYVTIGLVAGIAFDMAVWFPSTVSTDPRGDVAIFFGQAKDKQLVGYYYIQRDRHSIIG